MRLWWATVVFLVALAIPRLAGAQEDAQTRAQDAATRPATHAALQQTAPARPAGLPEVDCVEKSHQLRLQMRFQEAEKNGRACVESQPKNPDAWVELGRALAAQAKTDEALSWVNKALGQYPDSQSLKLLKARLLAWNNDLKASRTLLESLPNATFQQPEAMRLRGDVMLWDHDFSEAVKWYNRYNQVDPDNPLVLYKRAQALGGMGNNSQALTDLRRSCEIAPQATNACQARDDFAQNAYPKIYANVFYGYSRVIGRLDGWNLEGAVGSEVNKQLTLMGTWERLSRPFFDHRSADWRFNGWGAYQLDSGLFLMAGGGFSPDPVFSPKWNALAEAGWKFEDFKVSGRFWHIDFPHEANEVLNANGEIYWKPYMLELRYFATFAPGEGAPSHSGFGRVFYFFSDLTQFYIGGGGGQKSDFLQPRDLSAESHWLVTAGFRYLITNHHRVMLTFTQRHDSANTQTYDQTETAIGYEFRL